jgi:hypothetical protein
MQECWAGALKSSCQILAAEDGIMNIFLQKGKDFVAI